MKPILIAWLGALATAVAPQGTPSKIQNMAAKLDLTPDRHAKVDPILTEDPQQVRALREKS